MSNTTATEEGTSSTHPYTCISCQLAFVDAQSQRQHYQTDLHRYNSKRRVAGLPPVTQLLFDQKLGNTAQTALENTQESHQKLACKACNKTFNSDSTFQSHIQSKKHKEAAIKHAKKVVVQQDHEMDIAQSSQSQPLPEQDQSMTSVDESEPVASSSSSSTPETATEAATTEPDVPSFQSSGDPKLDLLVAKRLRSAPPLSPTSCLFCPRSNFSTPQENVEHMRQAHGFHIPETEYLVDLEGLLKRLGEEIGTWNVCIFCGKGYGGNINLDQMEGVDEDEMRKRASKGVEAVRSHMDSKSHRRLPYETEEQRLDLADFYDFRPSYPDYISRQEKKAARKAAKEAKEAAEGWEDASDSEMQEGDEGVEVVYESNSDDDSSEYDSDDDEELPETTITYGDTSYELVLPSGARIGHRAHAKFFRQGANLGSYLGGQVPFKPAVRDSAQEKQWKPSPHSEALLRLVPAGTSGPGGLGQGGGKGAKPLYDSSLVPAKGAGKRHGTGEVIKARNKGEAKEAGKSTRTYKELRVHAEQAYVRGIRGNNQKHFRDFLLQ
ncbi:hypothetical protein T439DRAFT_310749 [Meredithblackwellia eburnea MCA 4105]